VDTELRWRLLSALVASGAAGSDEIDEELDRDRTAGGQAEAATLRALIPTAEAKAAAWERLTAPAPLSSWLCRAIGDGFRHPAPAQVALTAPYGPLFFAELDAVWRRQEPQTAQAFAKRLYPGLQVSEATLTATDHWSGGPARPASLRRLIAEGRDGVQRALAARAADALAAEGARHS
jgi:aminopeptidase N